MEVSTSRSEMVIVSKGRDPNHDARFSNLEVWRKKILLKGTPIARYFFSMHLPSFSIRNLKIISYFEIELFVQLV